MVVPFKWNARQTPVVNPNRTVVAKVHTFVCWFHGRNRKVIVWIVSLLWARPAYPADMGELTRRRRWHSKLTICRQPSGKQSVSSANDFQTIVMFSLKWTKQSAAKQAGLPSNGAAAKT